MNAEVHGAFNKLHERLPTLIPKEVAEASKPSPFISSRKSVRVFTVPIDDFYFMGSRFCNLGSEECFVSVEISQITCGVVKEG